MRSLVIVLGLLLLGGVLWQGLGHGGVLPHIPAQQRAALQTLRTPEPALPGRNAAVAANLVLRGIAPEDWPRYEKLPPETAMETLDPMPAAPDIGRDELPACHAWGTGCLQAVREDPDQARAVRERVAARLAGIDAFERNHQHLAVIGEWNLTAAVPPMQGLHAPVRLDTALRFLDGDASGALHRICSHAGFWRRMRQHTDLLIVDMVGVAYLSGAANSVAELLSQLPADTPLPADCEVAFAPLADAELHQCRVMKTEFSGYENTWRDPSAQPGLQPGVDRQPGLMGFLLYRHEPTMALLAPPFARFCDAEHEERIAARVELPPPTPLRCAIDGWIFNYVGCVIAGIASPTLGHGDFYHRLLDLDGRLKLASTALWLHRQGDADLAAAFARRPEPLRDIRHRLDGGHCSPTLHFAPRQTRPGAEPWVLPLAPPSGCAMVEAP